MTYSRLNPGDLVVLDLSQGRRVKFSATFFDDDNAENDTKFRLGDVALVIGYSDLFPRAEVRVLFKTKIYIAEKSALKKVQSHSRS